MSIECEKYKIMNTINTTNTTNTINIMKNSNQSENDKTGYKIFVGNVPYQCTQEEFEKCFENIKGFIKGEIITIHKTNMSRGFGFVTMQTYLDAENLKLRDDIEFKGRILRFTSYQSGSNPNNAIDIETYSNYVYVDGVPRGKDRKWLKKCFSEYEPIGKCFIMF